MLLYIQLALAVWEHSRCVAWAFGGGVHVAWRATFTILEHSTPAPNSRLAMAKSASVKFHVVKTLARSLI